MIHTPLPHEPPFMVEVMYEPKGGNHFEPHARVTLGRGLQELVLDIGVEAVGYLALMMTFVTANGAVCPTAADIGSAVGRPWLVRLRLSRLTRQYWRGQPLLRAIRRPSGLETFHPTPIVLGYREHPLPASAALPSAAPATNARERIIEQSRAMYATPREDVERTLQAHMGWMAPDEYEALAEATAKPPDDLDERWAVSRLCKAGVDFTLAIKLVKQFGAERCLKQLKWLPYRQAIKHKARYIVSAIQNDYPPPTAVN